jgi:hypothetical protein
MSFEEAAAHYNQEHPLEPEVKASEVEALVAGPRAFSTSRPG